MICKGCDYITYEFNGLSIDGCTFCNKIRRFINEEIDNSFWCNL